MAKRSGRSIPFNVAMNILVKLGGPICAAISYPVAFQRVGSEEMGKVAFAASIASFFVMLASLGIPTYGIRECAKVRDNPGALRRTVLELLILQAVMTGITELLLWGCVLLVPKLRQLWPLFAIQGSMILFQALDTEWLFAALERYDVLALRSCSAKVLSVILVITMVKGRGDTLLYAAILAAPTVLYVLIKFGKNRLVVV